MHGRTKKSSKSRICVMPNGEAKEINPPALNDLYTQLAQMSANRFGFMHAVSKGRHRMSTLTIRKDDACARPLMSFADFCRFQLGVPLPPEGPAFWDPSVRCIALKMEPWDATRIEKWNLDDFHDACQATGCVASASSSSESDFIGRQTKSRPKNLVFSYDEFQREPNPKQVYLRDDPLNGVWPSVNLYDERHTPRHFPPNSVLSFLIEPHMFQPKEGMVCWVGDGQITFSKEGRGEKPLDSFAWTVSSTEHETRIELKAKKEFFWIAFFRHSNDGKNESKTGTVVIGRFPLLSSILMEFTATVDQFSFRPLLPVRASGLDSLVVQNISIHPRTLAPLLPLLTQKKIVEASKDEVQNTVDVGGKKIAWSEKEKPDGFLPDSVKELLGIVSRKRKNASVMGRRVRRNVL
eukprot:GEMP01045847.1.p1 GENE.GEMP01045847.1~~GEMP01045847.1.p1  ORF type:complete len:408 (+),score=78.39 GEMP01045847.1:324-1547(+)